MSNAYQCTVSLSYLLVSLMKPAHMCVALLFRTPAIHQSINQWFQLHSLILAWHAQGGTRKHWIWLISILTAVNPRNADTCSWLRLWFYVYTVSISKSDLEQAARLTWQRGRCPAILLSGPTTIWTSSNGQLLQGKLSYLWCDTFVKCLHL